MKPVKTWLQLGVLFGIALLGSAMFALGLHMETYESPQIRHYNEAAVLYEKARQGDETVLDEAILAFDKSLDDYRAKENPTTVESIIYPSRSSEVAALALSKKAVLLLMKKKTDDAVKAFKESISINSGNLHSELLALTMPGEKLSSQDIARLADQAYVTIHNLEMLWGKSPEMQMSQGKTPGKGEGYDPQQAPGAPTPGAGKGGDPNAI
ncbi:MAG: hypothetical protein IT343_00285 [Candidatus Melainabacteria bacterium]|jgi:tetratricopeptide (TPR) repeat protein|nr:hypothetical protein [Candidatus Melainabacteria bacterium]